MWGWTTSPCWGRSWSTAPAACSGSPPPVWGPFLCRPKHGSSGPRAPCSHPLLPDSGYSSFGSHPAGRACRRKDRSTHNAAIANLQIFSVVGTCPASCAAIAQPLSTRRECFRSAHFQIRWLLAVPFPNNATLGERTHSRGRRLALWRRNRQKHFGRGRQWIRTNIYGRMRSTNCESRHEPRITCVFAAHASQLGGHRGSDWPVVRCCGEELGLSEVRKQQLCHEQHLPHLQREEAAGRRRSGDGDGHGS